MIVPSGDDIFRSDKTGLNSAGVSSENQTILACVEKGLLSTLGASARAATLYFVESKGGLKLNQVSGDPEGFTNALRGIFGLGSAELLKSILRELRLKETKLERDKSLSHFASVIQQAIESIEAGIV